ncbi:MAG: hypothetical protein IV100_07580 [Myxococcales bacterium]|nr:hypothetical protein [Myxococcales bacterium]
MSELRVALVAEGPTDAVVIEAALKALLPRSFVLTLLQPESTAIERGGGWGGVLRWCLAFAERGSATFEADPTMPGFDLFVIHADADVAECSYGDVSRDVADIAERRGWSALPSPQSCPPPGASADVVRACLLDWAGLGQAGRKTVICVPSKAIDAWLVAAVLPDGHKLLTNLECKLNVASQAESLPKGQRIRKAVKCYRDYAPTITAEWSVVRARCTQAERFSTDVETAFQ